MICIDKSIRAVLPDINVASYQCSVLVKPAGEDFLMLAKKITDDIRERMSVENISKLPAIHNARKAYRVTGKDPARYRVSAEALLRRVVNGKGLYQVSNVVDAINLASIQTGVSIGGYDVSKIVGKVTLGIGRANEPYEAIGRGLLNIEGMPVLRDEVGAFGSMTSDSARTCVDTDTTDFILMVINFGPEEKTNETLQLMQSYLEQYCAV